MSYASTSSNLYIPKELYFPLKGIARRLALLHDLSLEVAMPTSAATTNYRITYKLDTSKTVRI